MEVLILNGPNLNLIGTREKDLYGQDSFEEYLKKLKETYTQINIHYFQSNIEGEIIDKIQEVGFNYDGILLNAGGYTHTSVAIRDAIAAITTPVIEVHMTNIMSREEFRHTSLISAKCKGSIMGFGLESYRLGLESLI